MKIIFFVFKAFIAIFIGPKPRCHRLVFSSNFRNKIIKIWSNLAISTVIYNINQEENRCQKASMNDDNIWVLRGWRNGLRCQLLVSFQTNSFRTGYGLGQRILDKHLQPSHYYFRHFLDRVPESKTPYWC
jgi:hypothetical protein